MISRLAFLLNLPYLPEIPEKGLQTQKIIIIKSCHKSLEERQIKAGSLANKINILHIVTFFCIIHNELQAWGLVVSVFFILKFFILFDSCQPAGEPVISIKNNFRLKSVLRL